MHNNEDYEISSPCNELRKSEKMIFREFFKTERRYLMNVMSQASQKFKSIAGASCILISFYVKEASDHSVANHNE